MTTTEGQPQPHTMHLHENPKTQLPMTTTEGKTTTPHHAFTCKPKRHGLAQKLQL